MNSSHPEVADVSTVTTKTLLQMKQAGVPVAMLTAYDYTSARLLDRGGADVLLVGDSAANVMAGHDTTLPVTLDQMVYHAQCVVRGADRALVIVDMPFGPVQQGPASGLDAAVRIMKETGASGVKVEGGGARVETVRRIVEADVPVMGHLGLTPQSIHEYGSYRVRARDDDEAARLREDARRLEAAGCFALVLEMIPADLARAVAEDLTIPAIGIGAGAGTDGQVLVMHDALGLTTDSTPGFVRAYADLGEATTEAVERYVDDVRTGSFPSDEESY